MAIEEHERNGEHSLVWAVIKIELAHGGDLLCSASKNFLHSIIKKQDKMMQSVTLNIYNHYLLV